MGYAFVESSVCNEIYSNLADKSGYRTADRKTVTFTTFYTSVLDQLEKQVDAQFRRLEEIDLAISSEIDLKLTYENKRSSADWDSKIIELRKEEAAVKGQIRALATVADDFGIVLPVSEIQSINIFSEQIHTAYFAPTDEEVPSPPRVLKYDNIPRDIAPPAL